MKPMHAFRPMRQYLVLLVALLLPCVLLTGCPQWTHVTQTITIPPPPCNPAISCVAIAAIVKEPACGAPEGFSKLFWQVHNSHPSRRVYVFVQSLITHYNQQGLPQTETTNSRFLVGVNGEADIDCRYQNVEQHPGPSTNWSWDEHIPTITRACFEGSTPGTCDDPPAPPPAPPLVSEGDTRTCSEACKGPNCVRFKLSKADLPTGFSQDLARALTDQPQEQAISFSTILPVLSCSLRDKMRIHGSKFENAGGQCSQAFDLKPDADRKVLNSIPVQIAGSAVRAPGLLVLDFNDPALAPKLDWYTTQNQLIGEESIGRLTLTSSEIKVTGRRKYCMWFDLPTDGEK